MHRIADFFILSYRDISRDIYIKVFVYRNELECVDWR